MCIPQAIIFLQWGLHSGTERTEPRLRSRQVRFSISLQFTVMAAEPASCPLFRLRRASCELLISPQHHHHIVIMTLQSRDEANADLLYPVSYDTMRSTLLSSFLCGGIATYIHRTRKGFRYNTYKRSRCVKRILESAVCYRERIARGPWLKPNIIMWRLSVYEICIMLWILQVNFYTLYVGIHTELWIINSYLDCVIVNI